MSLDPDEIFSSIDASQGLVIAVSGGSDSLALLLLLHDFVAAAPPPFLAVTIDHGLRPESAEEAARVAAFCRKRGLAHRTLVWRGDKPKSGVSVAAREARYELLAGAAADAGARIILTGHTLDDQAETLAMRASRGEGAGLAGMAKATLFDGRVWIVRPLLSLRRQALRDWLSSRDVAWIDDPSNDNPAYERVRVRRSLTEAEIAARARQAAAAGAARTALSGAAARLVERFVARLAPGLHRLERGLFASDAGEAGVLAFRAMLATTGGTPRLPDLDRSRALFSRLAAGKLLRATLSRTLVDARPSGIFLRREARGLPHVALDGGTTIWDGRFRICAPAGLVVGPRGDLVAGEAETAAPPSLARAASAAEPGLFRQENGAESLIGPAMELAAEAAVTPLVAPFARFLPGFDLALAEALGRLVGAPSLAASPWNHHIRANA